VRVPLPPPGAAKAPASGTADTAPAAWDGDACYKPFAVFDEATNRWLLWYNGRRGGVEQIGLAVHDGADLGF